jgi:DNA-binding NtrC family response regulator
MSKKVLICDDNEGTRESLKLILGDYYDIILTDNSEQCLECLKNSKDIGIVLLDIKMPKVNKLELRELIKKNHPKQKIIGILTTTSLQPSKKNTQDKINQYIKRPFKSDEILKIVSNELEVK